MGNLLSRAVERLTQRSDPEDAELRVGSQAAGCGPIAEQRMRALVVVHGTLRSVSLQPRSGVCALEADLYDGSGSVTLIWLGQRRIAGIEPGRRMTVRGRLCEHDGRTVMFNPRYELCQ